MKQKTIDGNKIFLNAIEGAGIKIPKSKEEVLKLFDDVEKDLKKMGMRK